MMRIMLPLDVKLLGMRVQPKVCCEDLRKYAYRRTPPTLNLCPARLNNTTFRSQSPRLWNPLESAPWVSTGRRKSWKK